MTTNSSHSTGGRFALLYALSRTFNSTLDLDEVLNRVMDEVIAAVNAERGFVALREADGSLNFTSARGIDNSSIDDPQFQISKGVIEEVAQGGEGILTSDAQQDDRFSENRSVVNLRLRSIICSPLKVKGELLGVIYVDNRLQAGLFNHDDLELLNAIASSAAIAIENARLYKVAVEQGRMERELQMAYRVQSSLIPEHVPQVSGWEFAASWQPAREVSGDFYDFIPNHDGTLSLVIGDVTDKGMPAALFMALTRSIVRASLDQAASPADAVTKANRIICSDSTSTMPVTLFLSQLDFTDGTMTFVNAGHNPPIHYTTASDSFKALLRTGMFMGFDNDASYEQNTIILSPDDFVVFYTDGVPDATNDKKETFGMERFHQVIMEKRDKSAEEILKAIQQSVQEFIGTTAPYDDLTMMIVKRL
jgi:sigma-B regulation protein RsbU (phosphoserine phosphatase)